jgi:hypothetical protein
MTIPAGIGGAGNRFAEKMEHLLEGITRWPAGQPGMERRARIEAITTPLEAVGCAAGLAVGFTDDNLAAVIGQNSGTAEATNAAANDNYIGLTHGGTAPGMGLTANFRIIFVC